jgi:hypothetical protein
MPSIRSMNRSTGLNAATPTAGESPPPMAWPGNRPPDARDPQMEYRAGPRPACAVGPRRYRRLVVRLAAPLLRQAPLRDYVTAVFRQGR